MAKKHWWGKDPGNEGDWSTAANWSSSGVPSASDEVVIGPGSHPITGGLNQSAGALGAVWVLDGYNGQIGKWNPGDATPQNLRLDCDKLFLAGTGVQYISLEHSGAIDVMVENSTMSISPGSAGVYLSTDGTGTIGNLSVAAGCVYVSYFADDPAATVAEAICNGSTAKLIIGESVTTTAITVDSGTVRSYSDQTTGTLTVSRGVMTVLGGGAITTTNMLGGNLRLGGTGTLATVNLKGGEVDANYLASAKTISALNLEEGVIHGNASWLTISAINDRTDNASYTLESKRRLA